MGKLVRARRRLSAPGDISIVQTAPRAIDHVNVNVRHDVAAREPTRPGAQPEALCHRVGESHCLAQAYFRLPGVQGIHAWVRILHMWE